MRIWSLHPKYLDSKGLVALWREALLAKCVLGGNTSGYRNHPQLNRFKESKLPIDCMNQYLSHVYEEATARGYSFNCEKIDWKFKPVIIKVTRGQLNYELTHLLNKLVIRDARRYNKLINKSKIEPHPLFKLVEGDTEKWEIVQNKK